MLKNKIWIVALFAALAIGFIGCTNAAYDWEPPLEAFDENVLQVRPIATWAGFDLNNPAFKFAAGDVIQMTGKAVAGNQVVLNINHAGWDSLWDKALSPDEEFDTGKITLTAGQAGTIAGANPPAIRVRGNTANGTFIVFNITVTRGKTEIFNLKEQVLDKLEPGETDYKVIFGTFGGDGDYEDKTVQWVSEASANGAQCDFMILGPGVGGEEPPVVPEYAGDPDKVNYVDALGVVQTAATDIIVDSDPSIEGAIGLVEIDDDGVVKFSDNGQTWGGGSIKYKFPEEVYLSGKGVRRVVDAADIEGDFDRIEIDYTLSNVSPATITTQFKLVRYGGGWDGTGYAISGNAYETLVAGTNQLNVLTWGAGGTGGIEFHFNVNNSNANRGTFNFKINKVSFTKDTRVKVDFYAPQTPDQNNIKTLEVLSGQSLGSRVPKAPSNPGWKFLGWYSSWDAASQNSGTTITGAIPSGATKLVEGTTISAASKYYATWLVTSPPPITVNVSPTTGTLLTTNTFTSGWASATSPVADVVYDGKTWNLVYPWDSGTASSFDEGPWSVGTGASEVNIPGHVADNRLMYSYTLPTNAELLDNVKITYDLIMLTPGKNAVLALTNGDAWNGGSELPPLEEGTGKTLTLAMARVLAENAASINFRIHVYYGSALGSFLIRVTKVEFYD